VAPPSTQSSRLDDTSFEGTHNFQSKASLFGSLFKWTRLEEVKLQQHVDSGDW
jgi:hypothetical protein